MTKEELIATIQILGNYVRADANTFLWAKSQTNFALEKAQVSRTEYDIGGGNFVIALSSLSFIGLLAKIYKILVTEEECHNLFNSYGVFKNETKAFGTFVTAINEKVKLIDDPQNAEGFWKLMRHGLVHCFLPKGATSTVGAIGHLDFKGGINFYAYVKHLCIAGDTAISRNARGGYDCNADLLAVRAYQSASWITDYLSKVSYDRKKESCIDKLLY